MWLPTMWRPRWTHEESRRQQETEHTHHSHHDGEVSHTSAERDE